MAPWVLSCETQMACADCFNGAATGENLALQFLNQDGKIVREFTEGAAK
jgi:hypothetical protein